ncbi:MAG: hypothetical protein LKK33_08910 [Prevotella sp.]|jgi:hypothetical protein|nr:hypothetical protein [Prevotella sp.]MCI1686395.1 hypothetical protein [Prevotella sp.]MCI2138387.1 hypothetical protein [Prevotella sp.]MCI2151316.1 hypothetical protein [Prevotella sp.]
MKKLIFFMMLVVCMTASAKNANDTIVVRKPRMVTIITSDSLQKVDIRGSESDSTYHYANTIQLTDSNYVSTMRINSGDFGFSIGGISRDHYTHHVEITTDLAIGWTSALGAPANMNTRVFSSWEIWYIIAQYNWHPWESSKDQLAIGFGIDWRNYRMNGNQYFSKAANGVTSLQAVPDGANLKFSRIKVTSITVPLLYRHSLSGRFRLSVGPVVNLNYHSSILTKYELNGVEVKNKAKDVHVNPVTVDFLAVLKTPCLSYYFKYSPCNALDTSFGPKFQTLSFGIYL